MSFSAFPKVEPFGEPSSLSASGHANEMLRFGYRLAGTDTILAAIEVPLCVVQQSIPQEVLLRLNQNGTIVASPSFDGVGGCRGIKEISLVQLVEELIEPRHLSMEEIKSDLEELLRSLENSFQLVRTTVSTLKSNEESAITIWNEVLRTRPYQGAHPRGAQVFGRVMFRGSVVEAARRKSWRSASWIRQNRHPPRRLIMYLATLDCATSNPSLSSSPRAHCAFSRLIRRINTRSSASICGRPPTRRDFQRQYWRPPRATAPASRAG